MVIIVNAGVSDFKGEAEIFGKKYDFDTLDNR